jgi:hypothetical protein
MNSSNDPHLAKTLIHGRPTGEISNDDIEQRARENALIAGRDPAAIGPEDRARARAELEGRTLADTTAEDVRSVGSVSRDPSIPPSFHDGPKPNMFEPNEQEELEHLVLDGVEEAQHDQMLEARKRRET